MAMIPIKLKKKKISPLKAKLLKSKKRKAQLPVSLFFFIDAEGYFMEPTNSIVSERWLGAIPFMIVHVTSIWGEEIQQVWYYLRQRCLWDFPDKSIRFL